MEILPKEKCLSLAAPRELMSIFTSKKLDHFHKNSADKIWSEKGKGVESALPHDK